MTVTVRWPDGRREDLYSPSLVMHDHLRAGTSYSVGEFVRRAVVALGLASERVRATYGFACTASSATVHAVLRSAAAFDDLEEMTVVAMWPELPEQARNAS